jgi:probable rRNA maturation factor
MHTVTVFNTHRAARVQKRTIEAAVRDVLEGERVRRAAVSVIFVDSRCIRRINRRYLSHDDITDVIAFPLEEHPLLEGEIYVNLDRARQQARERKLSVGNEVTRLVVHGTLHLTGYDDSRPRAAARMHMRQESYVGRLDGGHKKTGRA